MLKETTGKYIYSLIEGKAFLNMTDQKKIKAIKEWYNSLD